MAQKSNKSIMCYHGNRGAFIIFKNITFIYHFDLYFGNKPGDPQIFRANVRLFMVLKLHVKNKKIL